LWLAAALVGLGLVGTIVYMAVRPSPLIDVTTMVSVQVEIPRGVQDAAVVLFLDGVRVSKEELARPRLLDTGEHELVTKQDGEVVETHKFTVRKDDNDKTVRPFDELNVEASPHVRRLIKDLSDKNAEVRRSAARSLEKLGAQAAVPILVERVGSDWWDGDDIGPTEGGMLRVVDFGPPPSKVVMFEVLRALAPARVREALMVAENSKNVNVKIWAIRELGKLGKEKDKK
jgi:hypothetical protein